MQDRMDQQHQLGHLDRLDQWDRQEFSQARHAASREQRIHGAELERSLDSSNPGLRF
jgi:hypothetical protein